MKTLKLSKREINLLALLLAILMIYTIVKVAGEPMMNRRKAVYDHIHLNESVLRRNLVLLRSKGLIQEKYHKMSKIRKSNLVGNSNPNNWLEIIENSAKGLVELRSMKPLNEMTLEKKHRLFIEIECISNFENFVDFVYNLLKHDNSVSIERFHIRSSSPQESLDVNLLLEYGFETE